MNFSSRARRFARRWGYVSVLSCGVAVVATPSQAQTTPNDAAPAPQSAPLPDPFHELETKYLFGFAEGADIGAEGERSVEFETTADFQKRGGLYRTVEQEIEYEGVPTQFFNYELSAHFTGDDINGVSGLDNVRG